MPVVQTTIEALLLEQALRPLTEEAGPAGDYAADVRADRHRFDGEESWMSCLSANC